MHKSRGTFNEKMMRGIPEREGRKTERSSESWKRGPINHVLTEEIKQRSKRHWRRMPVRPAEQERLGNKQNTFNDSVLMGLEKKKSHNSIEKWQNVSSSFFERGGGAIDVNGFHKCFLVPDELLPAVLFINTSTNRLFPWRTRSCMFSIPIHAWQSGSVLKSVQVKRAAPEPAYWTTWRRSL